MSGIWLLPCHLLPRMHLARSCLNGLQKLYNLMIFLHTAGDAKKARPGLARMTETCKSSVSVCTNFLSLSTVGNIFYYFEMSGIWLLPCRLLPRMHLARSCLNGLQKLYNLMIFLHTAGDAKKARPGLARMTETCKSSASVCTNFLSLSTVGNIIFLF
jgi:acyl-CoA-binding protein